MPDIQNATEKGIELSLLVVQITDKYGDEHPLVWFFNCDSEDHARALQAAHDALGLETTSTSEGVLGFHSNFYELLLSKLRELVQD